MNRTYTPELKPDVLDRLAAYAASFRDDFNRPRQAAWCGMYLRGLIPVAGWFAWRRVWPGQGWSTGQCAGAEPIWLLIEEQADGKLKYAFSNLPADTSRIRRCACGGAAGRWNSATSR